MYRYNLVNNDEFKVAYKKYLRKNILKGSLIIISTITIIVFILLFLFLIVVNEVKLIIIICIYSISLILEAIVFFKSYKNEIKKILDNVSNSTIDISFTEEGMSLYQNGILKHINWKAVREVIIDENNLLFYSKVNGVPSNFFYLKFFDVEKEELIKDIEKYVKVKGC